MTRKLVIAAAALAAAGFVVATGSADARYVLSGKTEYANAPGIQLTARDCAAYLGDRLVTSSEYAKYVTAHPGYDSKPIPARRRPDFSTTADAVYSGGHRGIGFTFTNACR
jgi:hypothetical protein